MLAAVAEQEWKDLVIPLAACLLAFTCLLLGLRAVKRRRLVDDIPTSKTTGIFIGLVEVKGTAESPAPLTSFLAESRCVYYTWNIQERWSRTVTETYTDSQGRTQTRTRHESGWTTVASGGESIPFYLRDDYGAVLVRPEGATIEPVTVFNRTCRPDDPLYYGKGPANAVMNSDHVRCFSEKAIPLHNPLYVMGYARERKDVVAPEIAADPSAPLFLISTRSEQQISRRMAWEAWLLFIAGLGLIVAGGAILINTTQSPGWLIGGVVGYLTALILGYVWMLYNSLVGLGQRVRQAWSLVDVQLKRRHDLIPNLLSVVTGLRDYERQLQTELAALRAQLEATPPGVDGPDFHGIKRTLIAVSEKYPELKAQDSFMNLQKNLADTETRIALARGYFNDIATHYNTRLETIPDRYIARLARLQPQPLMGANDFERAPIEVNFAT